MANGDAAVAAGLGDIVVPATDDIRNGYDWMNKIADKIAALLIRLNAVQAPGTSIEGHWSAPPAGYLLENGASYSTVLYPKLFAEIGYRYGGQGANFNVPDSRGRVAVGRGSGQFATLGARGGVENVTLTYGQMPRHAHSGEQTVVSTEGGNGAGIVTGSNGYTLLTPTTTIAGNNEAHTNVQPFIVLNRAIKF